MPFDPVSWGLGFVLTRVSSKLLDKAFAGDLRARLEREVENWANELPPDRSVVSAALFPDLSLSTVDRPALEAIRHTMESDKIPSEEQWLEAFVEQWQVIRSRGGDLQSFFTISVENAREHLADLAKRVKKQCSQDERLFRGEVLNVPEEIRGSRRQEKRGSIFDTLIDIGDDLAERLKRYKHISDIPENERITVDEVYGWFERAKEIIAQEFGEDSSEISRWNTLQEELKDERFELRRRHDYNNSLIYNDFIVYSNWIYRYIGLLRNFKIYVDTNRQEN